MKQFIRPQNRLLKRNGILYRKNEIQEVNHPNRNTTQLVLPKSNGRNDSKSSNGNGKYSYTKFQKPKRDRKDMKCWGCGGSGHSWRECSTPRQGYNLPFQPKNQNQNQNDGQNLNGQQGEETRPSNPLPVMTREESTSTEN